MPCRRGVVPSGPLVVVVVWWWVVVVFWGGACWAAAGLVDAGHGMADGGGSWRGQRGGGVRPLWAAGAAVAREPPHPLRRHGHRGARPAPHPLLASFIGILYWVLASSTATWSPRWPPDPLILHIGGSAAAALFPNRVRKLTGYWPYRPSPPLSPDAEGAHSFCPACRRRPAAGAARVLPAAPDARLDGVETRSAGPARLKRDTERGAPLAGRRGGRCELPREGREGAASAAAGPETRVCVCG